MKFLKTKITIIMAITAICTIVSIFSIYKKEYSRYVFFFKNGRTGKIETEVRYIPKNPLKPYYRVLTDEIILGAANNEFLPFVKADTTVNSCFLRGETLYVDLPVEILESASVEMEFYDFYNLFLKNIFTNCKDIAKVKMFLDGKQVY